MFLKWADGDVGLIIFCRERAVCAFYRYESRAEASVLRARADTVNFKLCTSFIDFYAHFGR
jgi:hypothetical protein